MGNRTRAKRVTKMAAKRIMDSRLKTELAQRGDKDGDTPYSELYDGTTWRITNGTKREVGLMTSARLGALMTNAGRTADGEDIDPTCTCCYEDQDTARHMLLQCRALESPRNQL